MNWNGSVAVVTGASRGIGRAVALAAAKRGARVGLIARSRGDLEAVLGEIDTAAAIAVADVGDRAQVAAALSSIAGALGPVDILVNNAGAGGFGSFVSTDVEVFERLVRLNYLGTVYAMKEVLPGMIERRRGHIVTVASIAGRIGAPLESAYSGSKFAVAGLSEAVAMEVAPRGVGFSIVNPGPVQTDFFRARGAPYARKTPKPVAPERVARAVIAGVEKNRLELYIPSWLRYAVLARFAAPPLYRIGTASTFKNDLG